MLLAKRRVNDDDLKNMIKDILSLLTRYKWLTDCYVSDYFVKEHWKQLPEKWKVTFEETDPNEMASLLCPDTFTIKKVWPLSLLAHRSAVFNLSLDRRFNKLEDQVTETVCDLKDVNESTGLTKHGQSALLEHCYRRHVKPKKQHEIVQLAQVVADLSSSLKCKNVVDVGAGQGHLSRLLTYGYGLKVTTVEASGCHMPKANKFDSEVQADIAKGKTHKRKKGKPCETESDKDGDTTRQLSLMATRISPPKHVVAWIEPDISVADFLSRLELESSVCNCNPATNSDNHGTSHKASKLVNSDTATTKTRYNNFHKDYHGNSDSTLGNFCDGKQTTEKHMFLQEESCLKETTSSNFLVTGLHACGDLSTTMLKVFVRCQQLKGLASVACCYMKLSTHSGSVCDTVESGYPLSQFMRQQPEASLSWEARELACHFADAYHDRLLVFLQALNFTRCCPFVCLCAVEGSSHLLSHVYRAALQEIIVAKDPNFQHGSTKLTFKKSSQMSFKEYACQALERLGLDSSLPEIMLHKAEIDRLPLWKEIVAFYTLRLSLAPLLETLILLDRVLYLKEKGLHCELKPIFNSRISPRNFVLIASKMQ